MIYVEYIVHGNKSLLTIMFNSMVLKHMKAKCDDYLNFFHSAHKVSSITLFKADTGYRITRVPKKRKMYKIQVRKLLGNFIEFESVSCTYYLKNNSFIRVILKKI